MTIKICKDCKHFNLSYCRHPNNGVNLVYGDISLQLASVARSKGIGNSFSCGPEGSWFDPAPPQMEVKKRKGLFSWLRLNIGRQKTLLMVVRFIAFMTQGISDTLLIVRVLLSGAKTAVRTVLEMYQLTEVCND